MLDILNKNKIEDEADIESIKKHHSLHLKQLEILSNEAKQKASKKEMTDKERAFSMDSKDHVCFVEAIV